MSLERNPLLSGGELYLEMFSLQRIQFNSKLEENFPTPQHIHITYCAREAGGYSLKPL